MLVGSPHCGPWSNLQNLNMTTEEGRLKVAEMRKKEKVHLRFCVQLYRHQMAQGRYFLHEHPQSAASWKEQCMEELMRSPLVLKATLHQCQFGLTSTDEMGLGLVKKPTTMLTNSVEVHRQMDRQCVPGSHRHVHLMSGRAKAAQKYPPELCRAVYRGVVQQMEMDIAGLASIKCVGTHADHMDQSLDSVVQPNEDDDWMKYWDVTNGKQLRAELVQAARKEEIQEIRKMKVWRKVPRDECFAETGKAPIKLRWVDRNKKDDVTPDYRSRIVAKEIKTYANPELFAATPPVEYVKLILSCCASAQWTKRPTRVMIQDVKKAYFYAWATRKIYVEIPEEDWEAGDEKRCAMLLRSLYGTRDAAFNWAACYTEALVELGFTKGASSPCTFWHPSRNIRLVVHGDDFVSEGEVGALSWLDESLKKVFQMKTQVLGPDKGQCDECTILNRVIRWTQKGITWEPDARHAEHIVRDLGLTGSAGVVTPGVKDCDKPNKEKTPKRYLDCKQHSKCTQTNSVDTFQSAVSLDELIPADDAACEQVVPPELPQGAEWLKHWRGGGYWLSLMVSGDRTRSRMEAEENRSQTLEDGGWAQCETGWKKTFVQTDEVAAVPVPGVKRRTMRNATSGKLIEDLWLRHDTSERVLRRKLRALTDIDVVIELDEVADVDDTAWEDIVMEPEQQTQYRAIAARVNFLAVDRPDLQYASKETSRLMSSPTNGAWLLLKTDW